MLVKLYGPDPVESQRRYSPAECVGAEPRVIQGNPDPAKISTSHIERQNLTMRMQMRRFTRLTNGFSKKVENLEHSVALHFMWYNFARPHSSLGGWTTPAMAAGVADHVWSADEIIALLDSNRPTTCLVEYLPTHATPKSLDGIPRGGYIMLIVGQGISCYAALRIPMRQL